MLKYYEVKLATADDTEVFHRFIRLYKNIYSPRPKIWAISRDGRKPREKSLYTFVKIAKITAKTQHQITGPKTIIQPIKLHLAPLRHHYMPGKVFIRKILSLHSIKIHISTTMSRSHIEPASNKAHGLWKQRQR